VRVVGRDPAARRGLRRAHAARAGHRGGGADRPRPRSAAPTSSRARQPRRDRSSPAGIWPPAPMWMPSGPSARPPVRWIR
jgi:hypothetical protein